MTGFCDDWDGERYVHGKAHPIPGTSVSVFKTHFLNADGTVQRDGRPGDEGPRIYIDGEVSLKVGQARELAVILLQLAALAGLDEEAPEG